MLKMKKILIVLALVLILPSVTFASSTYQCVGVDYPIIVNGVQKSVFNVLPMNYNGYTVLGLRDIAEALNIDIQWDGKAVQINNGQVEPKKLAESCVMIYTSDSRASGVFYDYGKVLTCYHVVDNSTSNTAHLQNGDTTGLSTIKHVKDLDISLLSSSNKDVKPVKIGDSDEVKVGDKVILISSPKGQKNVISKGEVKSKHSQDGIPLIDIEGNTQPGSSGGAVFLERTGELIGIVDMDNGSGTKFGAIPINDIRKAIN